MVTVYLKDGKPIELPAALRVTHEGFSVGHSRDKEGIACYGEDDRLIARFLTNEIAGYDLEDREHGSSVSTASDRRVS